MKYLFQAEDIKISRSVHIYNNNNSFGKYAIVQPRVVSERVIVPAYIPKPSYSESSIPKEDGPIIPEIKDEYQVESMRQSCKLASHILHQVDTLIKVSYFLHILK